MTEMHDGMNAMHGMSAATWVPMMAAMMLPSALPAAYARRHDGVLVAASFALSYFAVWSLVAFVIYQLGEPQTAVASIGLVAGAVLYELTPFNRRCLARCRSGDVHSGFAYGAYCVGSSVGLMAVLAVLGLMSMTWMVLIAALVFAQKLLPLPHLLTEGEPA